CARLTAGGPRCFPATRRRIRSPRSESTNQAPSGGSPSECAERPGRNHAKITPGSIVTAPRVRIHESCVSELLSLRRVHAALGGVPKAAGAPLVRTAVARVKTPRSEAPRTKSAPGLRASHGTAPWDARAVVTGSASAVRAKAHR